MDNSASKCDKVLLENVICGQVVISPTLQVVVNR
jgi:hypothetical protein